MKNKFISCFGQSSQKFWALGILVFAFILFVVAIIAYGPWIPRTKTLQSLNDLPFELPANFADFPSKDTCTWSMLSHGGCDVIWGEHAGLRDVAEWRINFYVSQGLQPDLSPISSDPPIIPNITSDEYAVTSDTYYKEMTERLKNDFEATDLGLYNPQLEGVDGIYIARFSRKGGRIFVMCWVNEKIFVFVGRLR
jgi:hypothetical protein